MNARNSVTGHEVAASCLGWSSGMVAVSGGVSATGDIMQPQVITGV
jgi:hypothetical protein